MRSSGLWGSTWVAALGGRVKGGRVVTAPGGQRVEAGGARWVEAGGVGRGVTGCATAAVAARHRTKLAQAYFMAFTVISVDISLSSHTY